MIDIKELGEEEIKELACLHKSFIESHYPFDHSYYELAENASEVFSDYVKKNMVEKSDKVIFVAVDTETKMIAGFVSGWIESKPPIFHRREYGLLSNIFVKDGYRSKGTGRVLIDALKRWCGEKGLKRIELSVDARNSAAVRAFEKCGFTEVGKRMRLDIHD